ncbi:glycogen synthase GlgA [Francisella tularensis subsp. novicida FSC159]|uniref:glycogen synthase GlgA n=1 Tax=Francisella tularensis TaxID=263 RepID=UPI001C0ED599|nr:glycogen synthase GlgA [Francisella tularensis]MBK2111974.1 glycogen synthase GlgA [Francisella tularensis subsp. novicida FSC159]
MRVLHVCSELYPILKTGGLADVTAALPPALASFGVNSRVLVPGFPAFMNAIKDKQLLINIPSRFGAEEINIFLAKVPNTKIDIYVIDAPSLFARPGNPYADSSNQAYADNYLRFALLGWVAARISEGLDAKWKPEIVHSHDWHAGLVPAYIKASELASGKKAVKTVFTVHNLAYQGLFPMSVFAELDLPGIFLSMNGLEFYGQVSFMKAGLYFADKITTVSPTYAKEIQTYEQGCGLEGLLADRHNDLYGVLNGVDPQIWNPKKDSLIATNYSSTTVATGKAKCKLALQQMMGLAEKEDALLFGIVTRLTEQKGLNLLVEAIGGITSRGGQIVLLGSGDKALEEVFLAAAKKYSKSIAVQIGYDEEQAHRIIAGSDVIMVPSRFEPCGLTQLYGLTYGTLPLVHKVGGLADTVIDSSLENLADGTATGFVFDEFSVESLTLAIRRAFALYNRKTDWKKVRKTAMQQQVTWDSSAEKIYQIYKNLVRENN